MNWSNHFFGFSSVRVTLLWASLFHAPGLIAAPSPQSANTSKAATTESTTAEAIELTEEEARQIKTTERFLDVLLKNPRYGTALDRVYGHHIEFGTLDKFLETLKDRANSEADAGAIWMLLGLFESQRGNDAAAVESLQQAEQLRPSDALASYYLGQAQLRIGQSTEAIASLERAIERKPARADLLEIFQTLGRVHQRAQRTEQAMEVWQRLESLFPDDPRVLEQIAVTLAEEGQPALALPRYQKLAGLVRDDYRKVVYNVTAAELTIKTGEREAGLQLLEKVLQDLNPESWLYRDVRRRIDDVFLRSGDQDSLVKYYQNWLASHPEDVEGMARLAKFLASSARVPEATQWMEKVLQLAPTRADLRKAFIDQLTSDQRFAEAIEQYEQLIKSNPGNTDYLRDWGKLVLRHRDIPEEDRKREAIRVWNQILTTRPDDALTVSQVADLFRQNKINDQAEQLYRKAVELAPGDPQYREYLGEFLHLQGRSEEALQMWASIAEGARRTAVNVNRLAEVYNSFGFTEQATVEIAEALKLDPKDFSLHIRAADYHLKAGKYDPALEFVASAEALAANDDERDAVIQQRIDILQGSQQLDEVADELLAKLDQQSQATSADWYLAARYLEAARRWPLATEAIDKAILADSKSIPALNVAARIAETSGDYGRASKMNRTLAEIDRRSRGDHLMNVSRLEAQLGRADEALKAAQELIVFAPGNTDNYEFFAQVCLRFGRADEGLDALRKAVRINPNEPHLIMALAAALADQLRTDEAIEVYWRAFDKSDEVEDKVSLTMKLTLLYQQINQLDKLIDRLERERREVDKRREMTICLAQAWHTSGDLGAARQELEGLLSEDTRDTNLLNQLAKLCQEAADPDAAVAYQRQLVAIAPGHETEFPLAGMLMASGQTDEAREIFVKLTQREEDPVRQMRALDSLITQGNFESAIGVIEPILAQNREDWELLYREGVAWASLDKKEEAINRFQRILALRLPYESLGRSAAEKLKQAQAKAKSNNLRGINTTLPHQQSPLAMRSMASQVQTATGLIADNRYYGTNQTPPVWTPEAYGVARMAALGWLIRFEDEDGDKDDVGVEATQTSGTTDQATTVETGKALEPPSDSTPASLSIVDLVRDRAMVENATRDAIYDWLYVAQLKSDFPTVFEIARLLARAGGKEEYQFYLTSLKLRHTDVNQNQAGGNRSGAASANKTPLSEDDLQLARDCYTLLNDTDKSVDLESLYGSNIAFGSNGQAYVLVGGSYSPLPGVFRGEGGYLTVLVEELRLAGHSDEALQLLNEHLAAATTASQLAGVMSLLFSEERFDELPDTLERWQQAALKQIADAPVTAPTRGSSRSAAQANSANVMSGAQNILQQWLGKLGEDEENALVLTVLDRCLTVAEAEVRHQRLVQAAQTRRTQQAAPTSAALGRVSVYYGKQQTHANLNFPPVSRWLDRTGITLLYQTHEVLKHNDVGSDLTEMLRKRLTVASTDVENVDQSICNHLYLASALWWVEEQDEAVEQMASAAALAADDLSMQFSLASMYETRGDFDEAATLLEKIVPRDQKILQAIELRMLQLAERLGDTDRARTAAERLFGLRLDSQTQLSLVDRMRRLGLGAMADAVLARAERTATNQTSSLASLMMLYQGQGKVEQATQLAHILLRKTTSPININIRSGRNPSRYRTQDSGFRTQALQLLQRSGALQSLIAQLESQLERSPDSIPAMQQLIEFYEATNQKEDVLRIVQQGLKIRPDSPMLRLQLAKQLEQSGKANEACDQYLELLKIKPDWVTDELYQIDRVFTQAKRKADLVNGLSQINLKQVSQPYYIFQTASGLLADEETVDAGLKLLERAFDAFPSHRNYLTQNIRNESIWRNDRFYQFAKRAALPTPQDIRSNPWIGLNQINSYSGNGEVNVFFHQMLQGLKSTDKLDDLENSIKTLLDQQPGWHSGRAMLALLELATDRKAEAQARLTALLEDDAISKSMPAEACWIIGQELDRFEDTRDLAMTLFERAVSSPSTNGMNQLQFTPVAKLIDGFVRAGRTEEAKQMLLKQLSQTTFDQYDPSYAAYQRIENSTWAAEQLVKMNFPVDAMKLYRDLLDQPEELILASNMYSGGAGDRFENKIRQGLSAAMSSVSETNANEVVSQLLFVPETLKPGASALDLMLSIPQPQDLTKSDIKSSYVELLKSLGAESAIAERIDARLTELTRQYPDDLSIAILDAAWQLQNNSDNTAQAVKKLLALSSDHRLEEVPEGRRPNSRQRREAAKLIPLWLVAQACIGKTELYQDGTKLAEMSQAAAARQLGIKERSAILYQWGKALLNAGHREEAEVRWTELLELATQRPGSHKEDSPGKTSWLPTTASPIAVALGIGAGPFPLLTVLQPPAANSPAARPSTAQGRNPAGQVPDANDGKRAHVAPLTLSQFRTVLAVAQATAEGRMFDLSLRAVSESLKGGFPVPDPVAVDPNSSPNPFIRSSSSANVEVDPIESEVVSSLENVLSVWSREGFPSDETYQILKSLVLPTSHAQEIRLYISAPDLTNVKVKSLAEPLVAAAAQAGQLDDLRNVLTERQSTPQAQLAGAALNVLIGLQQNSSKSSLEPLQQITSQSLEGMSSQDRLVAFLAALRAFDSPELKEIAFPILRQTLQWELQSQRSQNRDISVAGKLANLVNRHLSEAGDEKAVFEYFDQLLVSRQAHYSANAEYGLYMQRNDLINLAKQASELDMTTVAINYLGRAVDFEETQYGSPDFSIPFSMVIRPLRSLPPHERYAAWLKWTMPIEGRQTLRALHQVHAPVVVPRAFTTANRPYDTQLHDTLLSNFTELVDAAQQANQLAELRSLVQPLVDAKEKSADMLLALILIAQEDAAVGIPLVESLQATFADRMKAEREAKSNGNNRGRPASVLADYLVFQACLQSPTFVSLYEHRLPQFRRQLQQQSGGSVLNFINSDWARRASSPIAPDLKFPSDPFAHWVPVGGGNGNAQPLPWWSLYQDQLMSLGGAYESKLLFRYPLAGDHFTIEMDYFGEGRSVGSASFGGVLVTPTSASGSATIRSLSGHENFNRYGALKRSNASSDRLTIEVYQGVIRHLLNNRLIYQEPVAPTSPWLVLHTNGSAISAYRNIQIRGDVDIPEAVPLIDSDHLDGWRCDTFSESQPRKRLMKETPAREDDSIAYYQQQEPTVFDWNAVDGVLQGRAIESASPDQQSWIYYHRPLQGGESIEYEFFYKPGTEVAHPTIGQVALLLEPTGVVSHWVATREDIGLHDIKPDNVIVEPDSRRGPEQLPLKPDDWNNVQLQVQGDVAIVTLNGSIVCERALEPELHRQFGIFRYKGQSSRVRNVVLRGNWPATVPAGEEMLALARPLPPESILSVSEIEDDILIAPLAGDVVAAARSMSDDVAYDYLLQWVLPSATHKQIRLYYAQLPIESNAGANEFGFGSIVAPAVELVRLAVQLKKVDQLVNAIDQVTADSPDQRRAALALNTIIAMEVDLNAMIPDLLREVWESVLKPYAPGTSARERTAEFLVAWRAGQHPIYWFIGSDIARMLRDYERDDETASGDSGFKRQVHTLVGDIERRARLVPFDSARDASASRSQWTSVPYLTPEHRWAGYRSSTWALAKGSAMHLPADTWSQLFFQSPLKGNFEILASRTTHGHKELSIAWGMHSAEPLHDLKGVRVSTVMHGSKDVSKEVQLPVWDQQAEFRIVVEGRKVTTWTNAVQIHEQIFDRQPDPWLLLQSRNATNDSRVSNLRIVGTPEIPAEIDLIDIAGLAGWRADIYNESFRTEVDADNNQGVFWRRVDEELLGQLGKTTTAESRESLLVYQRPMLEDGEIEFEAWYEPGVFEVHPALGRQAFVLTEGGVKLHRLTDAQYETRGLTADNQEPIPKAADSLKLKPKDWNHVRLTLRGDILAIAVNGEEAASVQIDELPNLRQFGLFRYSNQTQARVRKLLYRGEWPKELPSVEEQLLSAAGEAEKLADARTLLDADLSQPPSQLESMHITFRGPADRRKTSEDGLTLHLHDNKSLEDSPGIAYTEPVEGDCEVTIAYRDLDMTPHKSGWGGGLVLEVELDDLQKTRVQCNVSLDENQQVQHTTQVLRQDANDESHAIDQQFLHPGNLSGSLRLVRCGGQIDCYAAADGIEEYQHLNSVAVGSAKIRTVACTAMSSDDAAKLDVTLTRLTIRGN
ncbi:MAG: DUF1583 domain-containing protein [Pirellulaceae bacterium]|nr:DUF1583 domain-containing protein [Pirellulaceae bacterium]